MTDPLKRFAEKHRQHSFARLVLEVAVAASVQTLLPQIEFFKVLQHVAFAFIREEEMLTQAQAVFTSNCQANVKQTFDILPKRKWNQCKLGTFPSTGLDKIDVTSSEVGSTGSIMHGCCELRRRLRKGNQTSCEMMKNKDKERKRRRRGPQRRQRRTWRRRTTTTTTTSRTRTRITRRRGRILQQILLRTETADVF